MIRPFAPWLLTTLLAACTGTTGAPAMPTAAERLPWLLGTWSVTDDDATIVERWVATPDGDLLGSGHVRIGPQVLGFAESLSVNALPDGTLAWTAWPVGQAPATFRVTVEGNDALVATRQGDGFPTRLRYQRKDDGTSTELSVTADGPGPQGAERSETLTLTRQDTPATP